MSKHDSRKFHGNESQDEIRHEEDIKHGKDQHVQHQKLPNKPNKQKDNKNPS